MRFINNIKVTHNLKVQLKVQYRIVQELRDQLEAQTRRVDYCWERMIWSPGNIVNDRHFQKALELHVHIEDQLHEAIVEAEDITVAINAMKGITK